ncbi:hypothetical protein Emed_006681 [Eimeria media]
MRKLALPLPPLSQTLALRRVSSNNNSSSNSSSSNSNSSSSSSSRKDKAVELGG